MKMNDRPKLSALALSLLLICQIPPALAVQGHDARETPHDHATTRTPIKHIIVIIGENHTFDNLFGAYQPRPGQTINNGYP